MIMETSVEALYKSAAKMQLGWNPEPQQVASYKLYVGITEGSLSKLAENIPATTSKKAESRGKVFYEADIEDVRTLLSLSSTVDFTNIILYWAITWVDSTGTENPLSDSNVKKIYPVGVTPKTKKDDPTQYRQIFGFSDDLLRWIKLAASSYGGLAVDTSDYYKANITTEYTYTGGGDVSTAKSYLSDRTTSGSPAKLTIYEYSGGNLVKTTVTDSTV